MIVLDIVFEEAFELAEEAVSSDQSMKHLNHILLVPLYPRARKPHSQCSDTALYQAIPAWWAHLGTVSGLLQAMPLGTTGYDLLVYPCHSYHGQGTRFCFRPEC
jgi:hypothetical protein